MELDESSINDEMSAEENEDDKFPDSAIDSSSNSSIDSVDGTSCDTRAQSLSSETSSSGEESSEDGDDGDDDSQPQPEEMLETCVAAGTKVKLPRDLCEHEFIFNEMFNQQLFWTELSESQKESICSLLPDFPKDCNVQKELNTTIKMLFNKELHRFGTNPLDDFFHRLSSGYFRPDIKKVRNLVLKAKRKKWMHEEQKRAYKLTHDVLRSRENLLFNAYKQGYSQVSHCNFSSQWTMPKLEFEKKAAVRYKNELKSLKMKYFGTDSQTESDFISEDELSHSRDESKKKSKSIASQANQNIDRANSPLEDDDARIVFSTLQKEMPPKDVVSNLEISEEDYENMLSEHKKRRAVKDVHPELNTQGIALSDLLQRAKFNLKNRITIPTTERINTAKKRIKVSHSPVPIKISLPLPKVEPPSNNYPVTKDTEQPSISESSQKYCLSRVKSEPSELFDIKPFANSAPLPTPVTPQIPETVLEPEPAISFKHAIPVPDINIKEEEMMDVSYSSDVKENITLSTDDIVIPQEPEPILLPKIDDLKKEIDDKTELDLESIDMIDLPIQLDDSIDILVKDDEDNIISIPDKDIEDSIVDDIVINRVELMQETCVCFFSLIRNIFLSQGVFRMNTAEIKKAVATWQDNPISPLNDWYSLSSSWSALIPQALGFLAGELVCPQDNQLSNPDEDFVPYLENKGDGVYAWIGAGRDSDAHLSVLCDKFLLYKDLLAPPLPLTHNTHKQPLYHFATTVQSTVDSVALPNTSFASSNINELVDKVIADSQNMSHSEWEPPSPLYPTDWKVCPSTPEEREEFRRQERLRYANPHKAFTYKMHGYSSVVGPVKGIYQHNPGSGLTKARGHTLLVPERPNFVTILALVRDATARLPNGEGTRADICQLLKDSQYIQEDIFNKDKEGNLNSVVSGALDRLHYETDPCVRYYPKRKEWLYLHRARSESEFELYHQQLQGVPKNKKNVNSSGRNKSSQSTPKASNNSKDQNLPSTPKDEKKAFQPATPTRKEQVKIEEKPQKIEKLSVSQSCQVSSPYSVAPVGTANKGTYVHTVAIAKPLSGEKSFLIQKNNDPVKLTSKTITIPKTLPPTTVVAISNSSIYTSANSNPTITTFVPVSGSIIPRAMPENTLITVKQEPQPQPTSMANTTSSPLKKVPVNLNVKSLGIIKSNASQSLLQSNQHFPHQQIQVSTSAGLQTIRLTGHSVLQTSRTTTPETTSISNMKIQSQSQSQPSILSAQNGKSLLQTSNLKHTNLQQQQQIQQVQQTQQQQQQQQPQHSPQQVVQGKTLLASQIKLVSSGQIKSLLTSHGLQGQTLFIKHSPTSTPTIQAQQTQQPVGQQQCPQAQSQMRQRLVTISQAQNTQNPGVQRLIAQIGGKPIAVQIQPQQIQQQPQQQKVLAKVVTNTGSTQFVTVESLLAQKGLKLATAATQATDLNRTGKILPQQAQQTLSQPQAVRMMTSLGGKPILLASGNKNIGVNLNTAGGVVLGKQLNQQQTPQQPIILPSQLLNLKTLHGLKVVPTPGGLKTTGTALYARVLAPGSLGTNAQPTCSTPQRIQTVVQQQQPQQQQQTQNTINNSPANSGSNFENS